MIVTTGLALIYESAANYIAGGVEQTLPSNLRAFGQMPGDIILAVLACVVAYIFLNYTKIGTYTYAIGSNEISVGTGPSRRNPRRLFLLLCGVLWL